MEAKIVRGYFNKEYSRSHGSKDCERIFKERGIQESHDIKDHEKISLRKEDKRWIKI